MTKKRPIAPIIIVLIFSCIFAGPLSYRIYHFIKDYYEYDFESIKTSSLSKGDVIQAEMLFQPNEAGEHIYFKSEAYRFNTRHLIYNVLEIHIPKGTKLKDSNNNSFLLKSIDNNSFDQVIGFGRSLEKYQSKSNPFLFMPFGKDSVIRVLIKADEMGKTILSDTLWKYGAVSKKRGGVTSMYNFLIDNDKTFEKHSYHGPKYSTTYIAPNSPIIGEFKVTNTSPLQIECTKVLLLKSVDENKDSTISKWFSGFDLIIWIVFVLLFCVSLFFMAKMISKLIKGEPLE